MAARKPSHVGGGCRYRPTSPIYLYATVYAGTARNTIAGWTVLDIEAVMADLRGRGVIFEDYDLG